MLTALPAFTGLAPWLRALPTPATVQRRVDLDALRGLAIFLVVVGHVVARDLPAGNEWYAVLKDLIYRFHMPLFMTLTGMTFGMSVPAFASWAEARSYSWRKGLRLAIPYFVFGFAILVGKLGAAHVMHVDNVPLGTFADLAQLLTLPARSAAGFLWFIYVLAIYLLVLPSVLFALKRRPMVLLLAAILLSLAPWPELFMLDRLMDYLPFYCLGVVLCLRRDLWSPIPGWIGWSSVLTFGILLTCAYTLDPADWVVGTASIPALLFLVQRAHETIRRFWAFVGLYSMAIYLMNTIVIGITKGLMLKWQPWDWEAFLVFFPVLLLVGCVVPIIVKRWAEQRLPRLARYL